MNVKNKAGKRFGKLVVIKFVGTNKEGKARWLCQCDCGNTAIVTSNNLRKNKPHTTSCGCKHHRPVAKDITGKKFAKLTVIERAFNYKENDKRAYWLCKCECGNKAIVLGSRLRHGLVKSCGCLKKTKNMLPKGEAAFNAIVRRIKRCAKERNLSFNLTREEIRELIQMPCYYCGAKPSQGKRSYKSQYNGDFIYNGLDRINNSKGYELDNVVACCMNCNKAKSTLTPSEFFNLVSNIHKNFTKKKLNIINYMSGIST